jgi:hypothetical protein
MKKLLLALGVLVAFATGASAQCVAVGGINSVPQVGVSCASEPNVPTYFATGVGIVPVAAGATDVACIVGSATKIVRIQAVRVSGSAGTLVNVPVSLMKRASVNTGAYSATTTMIPVPYPADSTMPAATATTGAWITANPTITDSTPGVISASILALAATGTASNPGATFFDWKERNFMAPVTLRGVAQALCVNFNTTAVTSGLVNISFSWTEAAQ